MIEADQRLAHQQEHSLAAQALGNWLEEAGNQPKGVPSEMWRNIAEDTAPVVAEPSAPAARQQRLILRLLVPPELRGI